MKPVYKKVKVFKEHCPKCEQQLLGNGSNATPYKCDCGEWKWDYEFEEYKIISKK